MEQGISGDNGHKQSDFSLTTEDIQRLIKDPARSKIDVAKKIADYYASGGFNQEQMMLVGEIFRTLVKDTEVSVRQVLAEALKHSKDVPEDVIFELAKDIEEISIPVLQFSEVLSDEDLIEIVENTSNQMKQIAIARREQVSSLLSSALIHTKSEDVVDSLLQNDKAEVSEAGYNEIVDTFSHKERIMAAVIERDKLPSGVIEYLSSAVSDAILHQLEEKHGEAFKKISSRLSKSKEIVTARAFGLNFSEEEYYKFLHYMEMLKIPPEMVAVYALTMGNLKIFEMYVARTMRIPIINVRTLIKDTSNRGIMAICKALNIPEDFYNVTFMLTEVLRVLQGQLSGEGIYISAESSQKIKENLIDMAGGNIESIPNLDYIITLIDHNRHCA